MGFQLKFDFFFFFSDLGFGNVDVIFEFESGALLILNFGVREFVGFLNLKFGVRAFLGNS